MPGGLRHERDRGIRAWPPGLSDHDRPGVEVPVTIEP